MPEDKSESNKDIFDSHPCFMEKSEKMQADAYIQKVNMSADFAFQIKKICGKNA